jgi:ATP-binding cassette subfamily B multidrug efflux pump
VKKFWKYLRKYTGTLLVVLLFTMIAAFGNLALPGLMSDIVNVGLQQYGIDDPYPAALSATTMQRLQLLMDEAEATAFAGEYDLVSPAAADAAAVERIPALQQEAVYVRKADSLSPAATDFEPQLQTIWFLYSDLIRPASQTEAASPAVTTPHLGELVAEGTPEERFAELAALTPASRQQKLRTVLHLIGQLPETTLQSATSHAVAAEQRALGLSLEAQQKGYIFRNGFKMLLLTLLVVICTNLVVWLAARIASGLGRDMRTRLFSKAVAFSDVEYEQFSASSLITRTTNDIQQIQMSLVMILRTVLSSPIMAVGAVILALRINPAMSWIMLVSALLVSVSMWVIYRVASPKFNIMQKLIDKLSLVMQESLAGVLVVRAFNAQKRETEKFDEANRNLTENTLFTSRAVAYIMPLLSLIMSYTGLAIVWLGAQQVDYGNLQVGNIMAFIQYSMLVIMQFMFISMVSIILPRSLVSVERVDEVITAELSIVDPPAADSRLHTPPDRIAEDCAGRLCFDRVRFRFKDSEANTLQNISFHVYPGQTLAIIGGTGSGKSTICRLIPRFLDVSEGHVCLNGVDIRDIKLADLRLRSGYVPQTATLFTGTVRSNLLLGKNRDADDEALYEALDIACASDFISPEDGGLEREISQGGTNLSGGQRQRLCIARALVGKPPIVVFDDSFSALDFRTDAALRANLRTRMQDTAFVIVAQRISTILHADEIVVLDGGEMVGRGTHEELLADCLVYREIYCSQMKTEGGAAV